MRNILRENVSTIWDGTNKLIENIGGGIGLWDIPPKYHNAFNPIRFVRDSYLHLIGNYAPTQGDISYRLNYLTIDNEQVRLLFRYSLHSSLKIRVNTDTGIKDLLVYPNSSEWKLSDHCSVIHSIDAIAFSSDDLTDQPIRDSKYIYLRQGQSYTDDFYIAQDENNIVYRNTEVTTANLSIHIGSRSFTITASTLHGRSELDISNVIKIHFNRYLSERNSTLIADRALYCEYMVLGHPGYTNFMALRAVAQIGESSDRTNDGGKLLTHFKSIIKYPEYPLDYSVLSTGTPIETANGQTETQAITRVTITSENEKLLQDTTGDDILDKELGILLQAEMDIRIIRSQVPAQPFYVRWLNRLGGIDYYMFHRQQKKETSLKGTQTFVPYVRDIELARGNISAYLADGSLLVTVGVNRATESVVKALNEIPFSPIIEWYNEAIGKWVSLTVSKFNGTSFSKSKTNDFEITFELPSMYVQF